MIFSCLFFFSFYPTVFSAHTQETSLDLLIIKSSLKLMFGPISLSATRLGVVFIFESINREFLDINIHSRRIKLQINVFVKYLKATFYT